MRWQGMKACIGRESSAVREKSHGQDHYSHRSNHSPVEYDMASVPSIKQFYLNEVQLNQSKQQNSPGHLVSDMRAVHMWSR